MMSGLFILWLTIGGFMGHFDALWERVQETSCELINVQCFGASMTEALPVAALCRHSGRPPVG